ncbi:hypothetical protein P0F02_003268 [Vibrio metschnikovii]|nr:hypothetical protein [Vibrio metschnikovii]
MEFFEIIKEPAFFVSTAIGSIAMSIVANLLTPVVSKHLSGFSLSMKAKQNEKRKKYISKIISISLDNNKIVNIKLDVAYTLLKSLIVMLFSVFIFLISREIYVIDYVVLSISLCLLVVSISLFNTAQNDYKIAMLATLRADRMLYLRTEIDSKNQSYSEYDNDYIDPDIEMYNEYLASWDRENLW